MRKPKGFGRFMAIAGSYMKDPDTRVRLLKAVTGYARDKGSLVRGFRHDLQALINLVRDWSSGSYNKVSKKTILLAIAALLYFLSPFDTIPDFLGAVGFTDDAAVVLFVLNVLRKELDHYEQWKSD